MSQPLGIDLVHLPNFAVRVQDSILLKRLFTDDELMEAKGSVETLAGMFAAKEAYFKAIRKTPDWHAVLVRHDKSGAPWIEAQEPASVSVSHDGDYVIACVFVNS